MKTTLTKSQSERLISLGVPKEKAHDTIARFDDDDTCVLYHYPIFRLTDLLEILPKEIEIDEGCKDTLVIDFIDGSVYAQYTFQSRTRQEADELIDSLYKLCVFCLENKFI